MSDYLVKNGYPPNPHLDRYRRQIGTERAWTGNGEPVFIDEDRILDVARRLDAAPRRTLWFQAVENRLRVIRRRTERRRFLRARVRQTYRTMGRRA